MITWPIFLLVVIGFGALIAAGIMSLRLGFEGDVAGPDHQLNPGPEKGP